MELDSALVQLARRVPAAWFPAALEREQELGAQESAPVQVAKRAPDELLPAAPERERELGAQESAEPEARQVRPRFLVGESSESGARLQFAAGLAAR